MESTGAQSMPAMTGLGAKGGDAVDSDCPRRDAKEGKHASATPGIKRPAKFIFVRKPQPPSIATLVRPPAVAWRDRHSRAFVPEHLDRLRLPPPSRRSGWLP